VATGTYSAVGLVLVGLSLAVRFHFWRPDRPGLPVLMYHYLTDDLSATRLPKLRVSPSAFRRQVSYLASRGYRTVSLDDLDRHYNRGEALPDKPVMITFDDGARIGLPYALDILSSHDYTAVMFVVSDLVGRTNLWDRPKKEPDMDLMNWDELQGFADAGWDIGSHTRTHADLTRLDDQALENELAGSKNDIEARLGRPVTAVSYPYGLCDDRVRSAARTAGYRLGFVTRHGLNPVHQDPMTLHRLIVKRKDTRWDLALKLKKGQSTF
jgi:peptidoglycan/xylan/chitin deacetylase (PgdA/CDA1 family)